MKALKEFRDNGKLVKVGDKVDLKGRTQPQINYLYNNGLIGK